MDTQKILDICQTSIKPICTNSSNGFPNQIKTFNQVMKRMKELGNTSKFEKDLIEDFHKMSEGIESLLYQTNQLNDTLVKMCYDQMQNDNKQ